MRVLLADENSGRVNALSDLLAADASLTLIRLTAGTALIDAVRQFQPDIVLVDLARPDRDALDSVRALSGSDMERPVALFVDKDDEHLMEDAFEAGVCSYNVIDTPPRDVKPLLRAAISLYTRFRRTQRALDTAQKTLSERDLVDRAKKLFMKNERCGEAEAYRWFRRQAMREARKIVDVCASYLTMQAPAAEDTK